MKSRKLGQQFAQSLLSDRAASSHRRERQVTHSRIESDILLIDNQTLRPKQARFKAFLRAVRELSAC
jgi:hypothetical protein